MSMSYSAQPGMGQQPTPMTPTMAYQQQGQQPQPYGQSPYQQGPVQGASPIGVGMGYPPGGMYGMPPTRAFAGGAPGATYGTPGPQPRFDARHGSMQYAMPPMQGGFHDPYGFEPYGYGGYYDPMMSGRPFDGYEPGYGRDAYGRDGPRHFDGYEPGYGRDSSGRDGPRRDSYGRDGFRPADAYGRDGFGWDGYDNDAYGRDKRDGRYGQFGGSRNRYDDDYNRGGYYGGQRNGRRKPRSRSPCC